MPANPDFHPTSGAVAILVVSGGTVPGINWKFNFDPKLKDVSNFRDGRVKAGTLPDGNVSVRLVYDKSKPPTAAGGYNLRPGATGSAKLYVDDTNFWTVPYVVGPIGPENPGVEDVVYQDVTLEYSNGDIVYPANG